MIYKNTVPNRFVLKDCIHNVYIDETKVIYRVLAPYSYFDEDSLVSVAGETGIVDYDASLLTSDTLVFDNEANNYGINRVRRVTYKDNQYLVVYEVMANIDDFKARNVWTYGKVARLRASLIKKTLTRQIPTKDFGIEDIFTNDQVFLDEGNRTDARRTLVTDVVCDIVCRDELNILNNAIVVSVPEGVETVFNFEFADESKDILSLLPKFALTAPNVCNPDSCVELTVACEDKINCTLTVDSLAGYVPNKLITVNNGIGKFKLYTDKLELGEQINLQVKQGNRVVCSHSMLVI